MLFYLGLALCIYVFVSVSFYAYCPYLSLGESLLWPVLSCLYFLSIYLDWQEERVARRLAREAMERVEEQGREFSAYHAGPQNLYEGDSHDPQGRVVKQTP
jgi:hypothetical protein